MTMTDNSPPPSPNTMSGKRDGDGRESATDTIISVATSLRRPSQPIPLPLSAVNRNLCYHFPSPPLSNPSSPRSPTSPRTSPITASSSRQGRKHTRNTSSRTVSTHARRRSSLSTCSLHVSQLEEEFGPPPHPAPTTPLPPIPGAPRVPYTTPQQERNRYSSYELMDKLRRLEKQQSEKECKNKRHSAPALRTQHITTPNSSPGVRKYQLESAEKRERILARRASRDDKLETSTAKI